MLSPTSGIDVESDPLGLGHTVRFKFNDILFVELVYLMLIYDRIREMDMETSAFICQRRSWLLRSKVNEISE